MGQGIRQPIALLAVLLACGGVAARSAAPAEPHGASAARQEIVGAAAPLAAAAAELSTIWPGYWPKDQAFIIQKPGEGALLVSPGEPPAGFEPLSDAELPAALKGRAFYHKGTLPNSERPFIIGYPMGEGRKGVLINAAGEPSERTVSIILHEQFHGHQETAFKGRKPGQFVDPLAIRDRVAFAAAAQPNSAFSLRRSRHDRTGSEASTCEATWPCGGSARRPSPMPWSQSREGWSGWKAPRNMWSGLPMRGCPGVAIRLSRRC